MKQQFLLTTNVSPNTLIEKRKNLCLEIARYWRVIETENVLEKGRKRNYDLKNLLVYIRSLYDQLIFVKLQVQCLNIGISIKDLPKDANIINIYSLSALREYYTKLDELKKDGKTINPKVKSKYGKKRLAVTEELTRNFVEKSQKDISLEINTLLKNIADFNESVTQSTIENSAPKYLTA